MKRLIRSTLAALAGGVLLVTVGMSGDVAASDHSIAVTPDQYTTNNSMVIAPEHSHGGPGIVYLGVDNASKDSGSSDGADAIVSGHFPNNDHQKMVKKARAALQTACNDGEIRAPTTQEGEGTPVTASGYRVWLNYGYHCPTS